MGNYAGKLSAEALTMNCKRNVKPEMAELKGKVYGKRFSTVTAVNFDGSLACVKKL